MLRSRSLISSCFPCRSDSAPAKTRGSSLKTAGAAPRGPGPRLNEDGGSLRIDTGSQPIDQHFPYVFANAAGIGVVGRQGMPVRHEEETVVLLLQRVPILQRPQPLLRWSSPLACIPLSTRFRVVVIPSLPYARASLMGKRVVSLVWCSAGLVSQGTNLPCFTWMRKTWRLRVPSGLNLLGPLRVGRSCCIIAVADGLSAGRASPDGSTANRAAS